MARRGHLRFNLPHPGPQGEGATEHLEGSNGAVTVQGGTESEM